MSVNGKRRLLGSAAVGLGALGAGELIAATQGGSVIDGFGRLLADTAPTPVVEAAVARAGRYDKEVTRAGVVLGAVAATAGIAALPDRLRGLAVAGLGAG
uniref:hypothetical protein n=1 Tax=Nocardia yamanashiensis TaxID=209247 RepID=UPI000AF4EBBA